MDFFIFRAAMEGAEYVSMKYLEIARDKVLMGPQRKARIPDEEANTITAYHEGGHAVVAFYTKESHPLHKVNYNGYQNGDSRICLLF